MDRLKIFQTVVFITSLAIVARLFYWQFVASANSQIISQNVKIPAPRGEILASDGFPLATNQEAFALFAKPKEITKNPKDVAQKLAPLLTSEKFATRESTLTDEEKEAQKKEIEQKEDELVTQITKDELFWVQLARKIKGETKNKIESQKIDGLEFEKDTKRFYPEASMSSHILGFVGSDKFGDDVGYFGLEGFYNKQLEGTAGRKGQENDPFGLPILVGKFRPLAPKKGNTLLTSIDRTIQFLAEEKLRLAVERYEAKEGTVIIAEPTTGNILAMATYPSYDPNNFSLYGEELYKNPAVADTYEPGSTFKLVTMSAALDLGLVAPNTQCDICSGPRQIGGFEISTWNKKYYPNSTMAEVIQHSDNIGMTYVADKLGVDDFYEYIEKFGFGKTTDIDLQEEAAGVIRPKNEWRPIDLATASFGQGLAVTPIQMAQAVQAIANGGLMKNLQIVMKIKDSDSEKEQKRDSKQIISPKTAAAMGEMMVNAVEKGEAKAFAPKGYKIAGKTGTAQIPVAGHYDPEKTIASFIGFAPADKPKFVMLVRFTEPKTSIFGSETAAPTFFSIAKEIFTYLKISPTEK